MVRCVRENESGMKFTRAPVVDIPLHMRPPNPEETEGTLDYDYIETWFCNATVIVLPSRMHPSYPYGNPLSPKHPAARPRIPYDPASRALFEDMGFAGGGVNGSMRWRELALDLLLPVDKEREEAEKAAQARKMASGAATNHAPAAPPQEPQAGPPEPTDEEDDGDEETDDNENNGTSTSEEDEEE